VNHTDDINIKSNFRYIKWTKLKIKPIKFEPILKNVNKMPSFTENRVI